MIPERLFLPIALLLTVGAAASAARADETPTPARGHEADAAVFHSFDGWLGQTLHIHEPLE